MNISLEQIYEKLKQVRTYLIKIGPSRREGNILETKLKEANDVFCEYSKWLLDFENKVKEGTIKSDEFPLYENYRKNFDLLYQEIKILCQPLVKPQTSNMDSFNLKTALSLLPVISDDETSVKQLIDNIQYYNSLLTKPECKKNLIKFILKSRLSQSAKLRLKNDYASVEALVKDMQTELLPKKGSTAIQNKLQKTRQNDMPIVDYGKLITELFVDLTISQADGNTECYNILKPINEKQAIKQFSDGLRNRRISTIISARNYSSLKDAIQAAQDEETSSSAAGEVMGMSNYYSRNYHNNSRYPRRNGHNRPTFAQRGHYYGNSQRSSSRSQSNSRGQGQRGRYNRGTFRNNNYRGNRGIKRNTVNVINEDSKSISDEPRLDKFFRE